MRLRRRGERMRAARRYAAMALGAALFVGGLMLTYNSAFERFAGTAGAAQAAVARIGSRGTEVRAVQERLRELGFFKGSLDGVFGPSTYDALKKFQKSRGLPADGVAGQQTLSALGLDVAPQQGERENELELLARVISAGAGDGSYAAQVAVGAVILNRIASPEFPDSLTAVIYQPGAFACVQDFSFLQTPSAAARRAARDALNGIDPTGGALYYYDTKTETDEATLARQVLMTIGGYAFCR